MLNSFDEKRDSTSPYGLSCELWVPKLMSKPDRHNEIEINFFDKGSMTYLFRGGQITIPEKRLAIFWGLIPHQIIKYSGESPYYVCTIPFSEFLTWDLPDSFVNEILNGEVLIDSSDNGASYDLFLLDRWRRELPDQKTTRVALLELQARIGRLALSHISPVGSHVQPMNSRELDHVVRIVGFIARHYSRQLRVADVGEEVGLHPDYANSIIKKVLGCTILDCIIEERIAHAQRRLITTDNKITEIAFECGFQSISRFNATFARLNGCTPREFRKVRARLS